jgi:glucosamine--fructose-6-phosphate aminotransferase (isomerizing)
MNGAAPVPAAEPGRGAVLLEEIREQPDALRRVCDGAESFARVARLLEGRDLVRLVAHGSSDNAASYGVYALGILAGRTAMRDSISLSIYYGANIDFRRSVVVALSQSGRTPDVIAYVERARRRGAVTIAITNEAESDLAAAADAVLPLGVGVEHAVAATKTYSAQLAALALLAAAAAGRLDEVADAIRQTAELLRGLLPDLEARLSEVAVSLAFVGRMFVVGRGPEYATAREISLKLLETCRIAAEPLTATDLLHGPVAAIDGLFPVWTIAADDEGLPAVVEATARARAAGATVIASGTAARAIEGASVVLPVPTPPLPLLAPILSVAPGQLLAWALAQAKGLDPDRPAGLAKVTLAR